MSGFSGRMKKCPVCGKLIARELMNIHLWGCHAKPQSDEMRAIAPGVYQK